MEFFISVISFVGFALYLIFLVLAVIGAWTRDKELEYRGLLWAIILLVSLTSANTRDIKDLVIASSEAEMIVN